MRVLGTLFAAAVLICWCNAAGAYRPLDGTDAAVAKTGEIEVEFGPVEYKRLVNVWAADHTTTLAGGQPVLVLDMYAHAYQMD
jgi:hypothetical protein